jgi:glutaconyl-CoA/methylmalonyl-CoA decarboxylase subunit gamma
MKMKRYSVTVNGQSYDVAVEEVGEQAAPPAPLPAPAPAAASAPPPLPSAPAVVAPAAAPAASAGVAGATTIKAPMPGTLLSFRVAQGQAVKRGDVILILEAMKMENEIVASVDGTVAALRVAQGSSVNTGDALIDLT